MNRDEQTSWIAFANAKRIARGAPREVAAGIKAFADANPDAQLLAFDAVTSHPVELDLRGSLAAVLARLPAEHASEAPVPPASGPAPAKQPGRPRLGVVAREVTLLPRHWEWLGKQPGGASVALRKLVEEAQRVNKGADRVREAQEAAYRFMSAVAGNAPGFEEATRALFAGDRARFAEIVSGWPRDVGEHVAVLANAAMEHNGEAPSGR